jgi:hypothetical protein
MVSTAPSQRTTGSLQLYEGGAVPYHGHLLNTLANYILVLEAADAPNQTSEAVLVLHLKDFFRVLASKEVTQWVQHFTKEATGEHLAYSLAVEMHNNALMHFNRFATSAEHVQHVLDGTDIPLVALDFYDKLRQGVLSNWQRTAGTASLGIYLAPPRTWVSLRPPKATANKSQKTSPTSTPGQAGAGTSSTTRNTAPPTNRQGTGSNPTLGMLHVPDQLRHGPQLPSGKRLCLPFVTKGKSCSGGYTCPNGHITPNNASLLDLQAIDKWVNDTPNVSWVGRRPPKLTDADPSSASPTSPAQTNTQSRALVTFAANTNTTVSPGNNTTG